MNNLALKYARGEGVARDPAQAQKLLTAAAQQGNALAQANLGTLYREGMEGAAVDYAQALTWLTRAAEQGSVAAQGKLGWMHLKGQGTPSQSGRGGEMVRAGGQAG